MKRAVPLAALVTVLLALLAGGCGGVGTEEKNAYVRQVNAAQTKFADTVTMVSTAITPKSSAAQDRRTLQRFEAAIDGVVADLRKIKVPGEVSTEHGRLVEAMSGFGTDIGKANEALENPTTPKLDAAQRRIATATTTVNTRIDEAIEAINVKLGSDS